MADILIVDDDPDIVEACRLMLDARGHTVRIAYNREDGEACIRKQQPDLLILDVMMARPDDGILMARALKAGGCTFPILMLTSVSRSVGIDSRDLELGALFDEFQEKPVDTRTMIEKVERLLALGTD